MQNLDRKFFPTSPVQFLLHPSCRKDNAIYLGLFNVKYILFISLLILLQGIGRYFKYDTLYTDVQWYGLPSYHLRNKRDDRIRSQRTRLWIVLDKNIKHRLVLPFILPMCDFIFLYTIACLKLFWGSKEGEMSPRAPLIAWLNYMFP